MSGPTPGIGRDRWTALAEAWESQGADPEDAFAILGTTAGEGSDARFETLARCFPAASRGRPPPPPARPRRCARRTRLTRSRGGLSLKLPAKGLDGFDEWLAQNLPAGIALPVALHLVAARFRLGRRLVLGLR